MTELDLETFAAEARDWLSGQLEPRVEKSVDDIVWGQGSDSVALFSTLLQDEERQLIENGLAWQRAKYAAGYGDISWPEEDGGRGLPDTFEAAFRREEARFQTPPMHEAHGITWGLIGNTIRVCGTASQKQRFLVPLRSGEVLWCQLFSEPGAGSDLAGVSMKAERADDGWVLNGQKVWTSGAQYAGWGYVVCRTDPGAPKHKGLTCFLVPMDVLGVEARPLRQMTGGSSFNEVFFTDVVIGDDLRIGDVGGGWGVVLTTLGFERGVAGSAAGVDQRFFLLKELATRRGTVSDPRVRQALAKAYISQRLLSLHGARVRAVSKAGGVPGPEGSLGKLAWTEGMRTMDEVATEVVGAGLLADTDEFGTYAWTEHILGTCGYRIAAGSDEIQRNIIGEMVLGLPREPRVDKGIPFSDIPR